MIRITTDPPVGSVVRLVGITESMSIVVREEGLLVVRPLFPEWPGMFHNGDGNAVWGYKGARSQRWEVLWEPVGP
jgi:hypothetical protein